MQSHDHAIVWINVMLSGLLAAALLGCSSKSSSSSPESQAGDRSTAAGAPERSAPAPSQPPAPPAPTIPAPLAKAWSLTMLEGAQVPAPAADRRHPSLRFDTAAGGVSGFSGVNQFRGPATIDGQNLTFGNLAMTRMAGTPEASELEKRYTDALKATTGWRIAGPNLELLAGDRVVARFAPAGQ